MSMGYETLVSKTKANPFTLKRRKFLSRHSIWWNNIWCNNIWWNNIWWNNIWWNNIWNYNRNPLKFKLGFLCVLSRPSVTKHCDLLFLVFLVPPDFFLEFSKNLEFCSDFLGTPDFSRFFFKKSGISSDFFGTPRFFIFFSKKNWSFYIFFWVPPDFGQGWQPPKKSYGV